MVAGAGKPALRFAGFEGDWEQRKLIEIMELLPNNTFSRADLSNEGSVRNIHYGDILIKFAETLSIAKDQIPYISKTKKVQNINEYKLQNGDIIFADAAEDETVGKCSELIDVSNETVVSGLHTIACRPTINFAKGYLGYFLNAPCYHAQLLPFMQGIKVLSLSKSALLQTEIWFPKQIEQVCIASLFCSINDLITLHQRKLEKLKNIKASLLKKMFPAKGKTISALRFVGFAESWKQQKLGDVTTSYSGGTPTVGIKAYYDGQIPFIRSAEINSNCTELFISEEGLNNSSAKLVSEGDILYALYGATSGEVGRARLKGAINQAILAIKPLPGYDVEYLTQWLRKSKQNIIEIYLQGGQGNLSGAIVKELTIDFPSYTEQQKIGTLFRSLNNLITLYQRKLEKLKNIKTSFLEKMFA